MSNLQETIFPLSISTPAACLEQFGGFTAQEMSFVMGSNVGLSDPSSPVGHLLRLREEDNLELLDTIGNRPDEDRPSNDYPEILRYRAGVCIGNTIVQSELAIRREAGIEVPEFRVDPGRRYLTYPEYTRGRGFSQHYTSTLAGDLQRFYVDPAVRRGYLSGPASVDDIYRLRQNWHERGMDFLLDDGRPYIGTDQEERYLQEIFGEVSRGIFDTFRLYRMLEAEQKVAPWADSVYDPERHRIVGERFRPDTQPREEDVMPATDELRTYRRWAGVVSAFRPEVLPEGNVDFFMHCHIGDNDLPENMWLTEVGKILTGFVELPNSPNRLVKVAFLDSERLFPFQEGDHIVVARNDGYSTLDKAYTGPRWDRRREEPHQLIGLIRGGEATLLHDLDGEPLNEALATLLTMHLIRNGDHGRTPFSYVDGFNDVAKGAVDER